MDNGLGIAFFLSKHNVDYATIPSIGAKMKVTILAPKRAKSFGMAPPTLILDPVSPIQIGSHVVLFIDVYLLKYNYIETISRCVNTSFIIN